MKVRVWKNPKSVMEVTKTINIVSLAELWQEKPFSQDKDYSR
jgi:hypothetical protein